MQLSASKPLSVFLIFCCFILATGMARAEKNNALSQSEAKAVLLYNFIKHTQWEKMNKPMVEVGFLGVEDAFIQDFKRIAKEVSVHGRSIAPQIINSYAAAGRLEVLVLGAQYNRRLPQVAASISHTQTLIISDGAVDRSSAMINYTYPESDKISFEINKNNIIFEGLKVSSDILLHGGSEIEVADLYNQMEEALITVKNKLRQQEAVLFEQQRVVSQQAEQIHDHYALMEEKNKLILSQTEELSALMLELQIVDNNLNLSQFQLAQSQRKVLLANQELKTSQLQAIELSQAIQNNKKILTVQIKEIADQNIQLEYQSTELSSQEGTIELQRNIILLALIVLLSITGVIIFRQKIALARESFLLDEEARLVVAQKKSIDAYELSLKVKNDFIVAINHELKTPMHIISSALYNIQQGDEIDTNLDFLHNGSEQMSQLINDMLLYSELQSHEAAAHLTCAPIRKNLQSVVKVYREKAAAKSVTLHYEISDNVPAFILVDLLKIRRVIEKILCNACKFTDSGMIDMSVRCEITDHAQLMVNISDTGIGIPPDILDKIYEPFLQRETGLSRRYEGLGIGLSICKGVMQLLGGDITVSSRAGEGTDVLIALPIQIPVADQVPSVPLESSLPIAFEQDRSVLLVEDNDISRMVMEKLLSGLGYVAVSVNNGFEALSILEHQALDLVLMDIQMPEMDGIECTRLLRELSIKNQPPVLALTANLTENIRRNCLAVGMNAVLSKPVSAKELSFTLNACFQNRPVSRHI